MLAFLIIGAITCKVSQRPLAIEQGSRRDPLGALPRAQLPLWLASRILATHSPLTIPHLTAFLGAGSVEEFFWGLPKPLVNWQTRPKGSRIVVWGIRSDMPGCVSQHH